VIAVIEVAVIEPRASIGPEAGGAFTAHILGMDPASVTMFLNIQK